MTERRRGHVCILTSVHPPFDFRIFHREARTLREAGHRVTLIAPGANGGEVHGIRLQPLPSRGGRIARPLRWPVAAWKAWRARADVYHFHDPELLPLGLLLAWTTRRPVIYDSHEFLREDVAQKHWIPGRLRGPVARIAGAVERFVAARIAAVVAVTAEMGDGFRRVQPETVVIRNLPRGGAAPERRPEGDSVVYTGLMDASRGLAILHDVAERVREEHPGATFEVYGPVRWYALPPSVPGPDDPHWAAAGVTFHGSVPPEEVPAVLAVARVGWLPLDPERENYRRAWPTKLPEYMAAGLPVVASDLPIPGEVLQEHGCGIVVAGLDAASHARAITELLRDRGRAEAMGERGRAAALASYSWEAEGDRLLDLYDRLLDRNARLVDPRKA